MHVPAIDRSAAGTPDGFRITDHVGDKGLNSAESCWIGLLHRKVLAERSGFLSGGNGLRIGAVRIEVKRVVVQQKPCFFFNSGLRGDQLCDELLLLLIRSVLCNQTVADCCVTHSP